jgi:predicted nucleic acid-binding protein
MMVVLDTNVLVAAIRSKVGASHRLLGLVGTGRFDIAVSVPLIFEYEEVLLRHLERSSLDRGDVGALLDYLCKVAIKQEVFFLWRPILPDPTDDMILELAVAAGCDAIVTFNVKDFVGSATFDVTVLTPKELLEHLGERP